jgi:hypothetical protein
LETCKRKRYVTDAEVSVWFEHTQGHDIQLGRLFVGIGRLYSAANGTDTNIVEIS